jgi:hypothetical protein
MFELPENLDALSPEELQALIDAGLDAFQALGITEASDDEALAEGERVVALITQVSTAKATKEADATARRERAGNLLNSLPQASSPEGDPEPEPEPEPTPPEAEHVVPDEVTTPQPVAASAKPATPPARRAAANAAPTPVPSRRPGDAVAVLTAAADVPGIPTGAPLEGLNAVSAAIIARVKGLPNIRVGGPEGTRQRYGAATIRLQGYGELDQAVQMDDMALIAAAGSETRLPGGSLTAAMGWCAPSQTLYDLCAFESVDGILDVPEFQVTRGGIRWTQGPSFADIYANCGFALTEQEAIDGTAEKTCCMVECPPFEEIRMDAVGMCIKAPLLTMSQYPELVRRFAEGALVAHQHKVNKYMIMTIEAAAGPGITGGTDETVSRSLYKLDLQAIAMRYQYRMSQTQTIEVILPFWYKALIKADWGMRAWPHEDSEAAVNSWFTSRNLAPQWVYDWQDLTVVNCQVSIPATVHALMYPAGTWTKGRADVINIDAVYDSTGLANNVFTALFIEEGILAVQRCTHTCKIELSVCASGQASALDLTECLTVGTQNPPIVFSTGATAGAPGTWTPADSEPPASAANLAAGVPNAVTASPATAWTSGQYVMTNSGRAHWNGTAWVTGTA